MVEREILLGRVHLEVFDEKAVGIEPVDWIAKYADDGMVLLAHADDGIIWGRAEDKKLRLAPPQLRKRTELRMETLQMARLFNEEREVFLWRTGERTWRARCLADGEGEECQYFDEAQILWGTRVEDSQGVFALVAEGEQGLRHAPPLNLTRQNWNENHPLRLGVRHYLAEDDEGWLRVAMSRLTGVWKE